MHEESFAAGFESMRREVIERCLHAEDVARSAASRESDKTLRLVYLTAAESLANTANAFSAVEPAPVGPIHANKSPPPVAASPFGRLRAAVWRRIVMAAPSCTLWRPNANAAAFEFIFWPRMRVARYEYEEAGSA